MRPLHLPTALLEGVAAFAAGVALFELAALVENLSGTGAVGSAILEECGKALLILVWGFVGLKRIASRAAARRSPAAARRELLLAAARAISFGLVSIAVFAAAENLAYFAAFPEAGILARLLWSMPVHLVAGLLEGVGALLFLRSLPFGPAGGPDRRWTRVALGGLGWTATLGGGAAWHAAANMLVERGLDTGSLVAGSLAGMLLATLLFAIFLGQAYTGGFLHGAD